MHHSSISKRRPKRNLRKSFKQSEDEIRFALKKRKNLAQARITHEVLTIEEEAKRFTDLLMKSSDTEKLGLDQLEMVCQSLGYGPVIEQIMKFVRTKDTANTGFVDVKDFAKLINPAYNPFEDNEGIAQAFRSFDYNHTGLVDPDNIKVVADELGEKIPEREREEMVNLFAKSHDRAVDFDDFYEIMQLANTANTNK